LRSGDDLWGCTCARCHLRSSTLGDSSTRLVFTSAPTGGVLSSISSEEFYLIQHVIPKQIIVPLSLWLAFMVLVAVFALALGMMASIVLHPSMSQMLRLNED